MSAVASVYFGVSTALSLDWLRKQIEQLTVEGHWQSVARTTLRDTIYNLQRTLTLQALQGKRAGTPQQSIDTWLERQRSPVESLRQSINEMRGLPQTDFATLSVALQAVRRIAEG
jgi:glutamate dehydrogenase